MLQRLAQLGEDELLMRSRVKSAVRYPMIVVATIFIALFVVLGFVIPKFATLFSSFKVQLPLPTRILLGLSGFITKFWFLVLIMIAGAVFGFIKFINGKQGRPIWDRFKLKLYVFGQLNLMIIMARFCRVASILLKSGLPILQILELVKKTVGNVIVERSIDNIKDSVAEGKGISEPMKVSALYPPIVVQMVAIGEETGKVDELLMRVAEYYDSQIDYMLKNLTTLIEPILIFFLGGIVLVMSLAIFLPMWDMAQLFRR
jgi:MSHA biogenesis protein MshG